MKNQKLEVQRKLLIMEAFKEDGKITEEQDFFDNYAFLQQIGILK